MTKYLQSFKGWRIYEINNAYKAKKGNLWSDTMSTIEVLKSAITIFENKNKR